MQTADPPLEPDILNFPKYVAILMRLETPHKSGCLGINFLIFQTIIFYHVSVT